LSRIFGKASKSELFYKFINHDIVNDIKKENETINKLLKSFNADEQDEMNKFYETDLINPILKLHSYIRKCVKYIKNLDESSNQYSCIHNVATLITNIVENSKELSLQLDYVIKDVIYIIKESTGKIRKIYAQCLGRLAKANDKCYDEYKK